MIRKLGLLLLLITVLVWNTPARGEEPGSTRSAELAIRPLQADSFVQEGDALLGEAGGSFVSEVLGAGWEFMALGITWENELPAPSQPTLEVRVSADGETWGDWTAMEVVGDDRPDHAPVMSTELLFATGQYAQVRATLQNEGGDAVAWEGLKLVLIDSRFGPKAAELAASHAAESEPHIISRAEWGANESYRCVNHVWNGTARPYGEVWPREYYPLKALFVHHTYRPLPTTDPADAVRAVYEYHALSQGWGDIGYHYIIDQYGNIYEGRYGSERSGQVAEGGHALGYNQNTMGVSIVGDFTSSSPNGAQMNALKSILAHRAARYGVNPQASVWLNGAGSHPDRTFTYALMAHRDSHNPARTTCPGDALYARMGEIRRDVAAMMNGFPPPPPPVQVQLTAPAPEAVVNGLFTLQASPSSNVTRVEYYLVSNNLNGAANASFIGASDGAPWTIVVDSHALPAGHFTLRAVAKSSTGIIATDEQGINVAPFAWTNTTQLSRRVYIPIMQRTPRPRCEHLVRNGSFSTNADWLMLLGTHAAWYDDARAFSPPHSLRVGMSYWDNLASYSSAWLPLTIPADASRVGLSLWYLPESDANAGSDRQYIQIRDSANPYGEPLLELLPYNRYTAREWQYMTYGLDSLRGRSVYLYVGTYNDGVGASSRLYVDEVQVSACWN